MSADWGNIPGFDPAKGQYIKLDLPDWVEKNDIETEGTRQGKANQPQSDAATLDATERKIVDWVNGRARTCREDVTNHLADLARDLADQYIGPNLVAQAENTATEANNAVVAISLAASKHRDQLGPLEKEVQEAERDFSTFRVQAKLTRLADYQNRRSALAYIFGFFIVEVILNAGLLMDVNPFGLLGSSLQMGLISAVNVVVFGLVMGGLLRQAHHVSPSPKGIAWAGIVVIGGVAVSFNLAVGHFRDSMQAVLMDSSADVFAVGSDALVRLVASPFGMASFQSAFLALVGFLLFGVASWKWLQRDDPYPDYGRRDRQVKGVEERYREACKKARYELTTVFERRESKFSDDYNQIVMIAPKFFEVCTRAQTIVDNYRVHLYQYDHDLNFLLQAYRTANQNARTERPPPHFANKGHVDEDVLSAPTFEPPPESNLPPLFTSLQEAKTRLQQAQEKAMATIRPLDELIHAAEAYS